MEPVQSFASDFQRASGTAAMSISIR